MSQEQQPEFIDMSMVDLFIDSDKQYPHKRLPFLVLYDKFTRIVVGFSLSKQDDELADLPPSSSTYPSP